MCTTCGCGASGAQHPARGHDHTHDHPHAHDGLEDRHQHHPHRPGPAEPGTDRRRIAVEEALFAKNDRLADANRRRLARHGVAAVNVVSSPGAGKTSLLVRTLGDYDPAARLAVIEGDQATDLDAERIRATGTPAVQINTGTGCHLDAEMVAGALDRLDLDGVEGGGGLDLLFIENVGNLVCPAAFDLGEDAKVVVVSVTEGDDKPLKYPDMFAAAALLVATKTDLLAHVPARLERLFDNARRVNPAIETVAVSAVTGAGLDAWYRWIDARRCAGRHRAGEADPAGRAVHA